jgi:predicted N-acetyltransferase YhbS
MGSLAMQIEHLGRFRQWAPTIAGWHFEYWGRLTGFDTLEQYTAALAKWSASDSIPAVLVAVDDGELVGSVSLLSSEMKSRPQLTPWLAQLFVTPAARSEGTGAALVEAAIAHVRRCGFSRLYLYTSGTLPQYYARLGWNELERVDYLGKERAVMQYAIERARR